MGLVASFWSKHETTHGDVHDGDSLRHWRCLLARLPVDFASHYARDKPTGPSAGLARTSVRAALGARLRRLVSAGPEFKFAPS